MKTKRILAVPLALACLALSGVVPAVPAQAPRLVDAVFLDGLRAEARTNHPSVAAAQARVLAAEAGVRAVRLWEDPVAGFGVMVAEQDRREDDGDLMFSAEQALPRRKLYEARKARATAERSMFEAETRSTALMLETLVAQAAIELALMDETLVIETNQLGWLESMSANARERLKDPAANASEPLRLEGGLAQERQRVDASARHRLRLSRQINILLGRPVEAAWPALRLPEAASLTPALAEEMDRLQQANPMLRALLHASDAARADFEAARRERSPVFAVGVDTSVYSGGSFREAILGVRMTLPWFHNPVYRANTERARQQQAAAELGVEALGRKLRGEAVAAHTEAENAARQAATFAQEVIPRMQKAAEATQNAWISSKASLLEILEARRALLNSQLEERRFVAAHRAALESLRSIVPPRTQP